MAIEKVSILSKEVVENWFIGTAHNHADIHEGQIKPKKLQKLMYYAYAWGLVFLNDFDVEKQGDQQDLSNVLFDGTFKAWVHGPVEPNTYYNYKKYGYSNIDKDVEVPIIDNEDALDILDQVWESYGRFTGNELEALTHSEKPWMEQREGLTPLEGSSKILSDQTIYTFYRNQLVE